MPPAYNNINRARSGQQIDAGKLVRLQLGELPRELRRTTSAVRAYRRGLEAAVMDAKGEVSLVDAHLIDEATTAEMHASVCRWLLRSRLDKMGVADIARCSEQILKAKTARNKAVERLGLVGADPNVIDALYAPPSSAPEPAGTTPSVPPVLRSAVCPAQSTPSPSNAVQDKTAGVCADCDGEGRPTCQKK